MSMIDMVYRIAYKFTNLMILSATARYYKLIRGQIIKYIKLSMDSFPVPNLWFPFLLNSVLYSLTKNTYPNYRLELLLFISCENFSPANVKIVVKWRTLYGFFYIFAAFWAYGISL